MFAAPRPGLAEADALTIVAPAELEHSGLLADLIDTYERTRGLPVSVLTRNVGEALEMVRRGEVDAVLADDYPGEVRSVDTGQATQRRDVMFVELLLVGPGNDPAGIAGMGSAIDAMRLIAAADLPFISRGDDSGIDRVERRLWQEAGVNIYSTAASWYEVTGTDMPETLAIAAQRDGYTITDSASWILFEDRGPLDALVIYDPRLVHQYGILLVNPEDHPEVRRDEAVTFLNWIISNLGQHAITVFEVGDEQPYFANAGERAADEDETQ